MKTIQKKEFIKYLKIISHALDTAEVKHDIPFCHINKVEWNYINVIISDFITTFDLMKVLNTTNIKEKSGIIYATIDDFDVRFIKSSEQMWQYNFYYYAWDITHILMNVLTNRFSMNYTRTGLYYVYGEKQILLTKNLKEIFDFFELPFHILTKGFATDYVMFSFIESAKYFNSSSFNKKLFKQLDYYYDNNKKYYKDFLDHMPNIESDLDSLEEQIAYIDAYFPKSDFFQKLTRFQLKEQYPGLKDNQRIFKEKDINTVLNDKEKQIKNLKKKKKINLGKYFKKKTDPGNNDFSLSD